MSRDGITTHASCIVQRDRREKRLNYLYLVMRITCDECVSSACTSCACMYVYIYTEFRNGLDTLLFFFYLGCSLRRSGCPRERERENLISGKCSEINVLIRPSVAVLNCIKKDVEITSKFSVCVWVGGSYGRTYI